MLSEERDPPTPSLHVQSPGKTQSVLLRWLVATGIRVRSLARDKKPFFFAKAFR